MSDDIKEKDPDSKLDFPFDWTAWLDRVADTIKTVGGVELFFSSPDLGVIDVDHDGKIVTAWLTGGVAGETYSVTCRITTNAGRVEDRTMRVKCLQR